MIKPIPRRWLIHSVEYYCLNEYDRSNNPVYFEPVQVKYVRVEPVDGVVSKGLGDMSDCNMIMFYDYQSSLPNDIKFKAGDKVVFEGKEYIVRKDPRYPGHHSEVRLK